jgi:uncharacterized protein (DUF2336 family)
MSRPAPANPIIKDIESALGAGSNEKRINVLMRVTDLFIGGAAKYTEADTALFDDVIGHLITHIESRALVELSSRLAPVANAPNNIVQRLARNDAIEVSGPILSNSKRLSDDDLIEIAKSKSQAHLAKIAIRPQLNEGVTEVLVDHGDADVANDVAFNSGARFSKLTMEKIVMRADGDDRLTQSIFQRSDISPATFRNLLMQATEAVRSKLFASAKPEQKNTIRQILDGISAQVGKNAQTKLTSRNYADAKIAVASICQDTDLAKIKIVEFADSSRVAEMIAALSALSAVPIDQIDRLFHASSNFGLMVLCRSVALEWNTACAVITARPIGPESQTSEGLRDQYNELSVPTALKLINFWRGRQKIAQNFRQATSPQ